MDAYLAFLEAQKQPPRYIITGTERNGKRFAPIRTNTPQCYNIYRGTVWQVDSTTGRRTKVASFVS